MSPRHKESPVPTVPVVPPTSPAANSPVDAAPSRLLLRELAAVILIIVGGVTVVTGAFHVHPGLGWMLAGGALIAGGYMLGKE